MMNSLVNKVRLGDTLKFNTGELYTVEPKFFKSIPLQEALSPIILDDNVMKKFGMIKPTNKTFFIHKEAQIEWSLNLSPTFRFGQINNEEDFSVSLGTDDQGFIFTRIHYLHELQQFWDLTEKKLYHTKS